MIRIQAIPSRRGVASLLAMIYLLLFSVLAVGFYATANVASQVSYSEKRGVEALLAAESGMDFMRNALHQVDIPPDAVGNACLAEVCMDLEDLLNASGNLIGNRVDLNGNTIEVPVGRSNYISLGNGMRFRAEVTRDTSQDAIPGGDRRRLVVKVIGAANTVTTGDRRAAVRVSYTATERPTQFFDHGLSSKGAVSVLTGRMVQGVPSSLASIMSFAPTNPPVTLNNTGGGGVAGDIWVPTGTTPSVLAGMSVGGSTSNADIMANHVFRFDPADVPPMPVPNTSIFRPFATNTYVGGKPEYVNTIIPPNINPTFNGHTVIRGVLFVQQPNKVTFSGQVDVQGVIVSENSGMGTLLTNVIIFSGNGGVKQGLETLPDDDPRFPAALRALHGSLIIAPGFDVQMTGNFGALSGHIVGDKVTISGSAAADINGAAVALKSTLTLSGNSNLTFKPGTGGHAGLRFEDRFVPSMATYEEIRP